LSKKLIIAALLFLVAVRFTAVTGDLGVTLSAQPNGARPGTKRPAPSDVEGYARTLSRCVHPGPRIREFVQHFHGTPLQRAAMAYAAVWKRWVYEADPDTGEDWVEPADDLLKNGMRGDCEDIAILLSAMMIELGIANRIVTTVGTLRYQPHAYTEILVGGSDAGASGLLDRLGTIGGSRSISFHRDERGIWIALDQGLPPSLYRGKLDRAFYPDGRVVQLQER